MWRNVKVAALNATLQLLVIYRFVRLICIVGVFSPHTRLIVLFGEPSPQGFVLVPECGLWDFHLLGLDTLSPTSVREAPHACLISPWSKAWCRTRTNPCGLGSPKRTMSRVCGKKTPTCTM